MEIKRNILLPKNSFALADDEDTFISIQLNRTITDIKNEKIDNVFNLNQQYNTERQNSLKFCIFGLVESRFVDTENIIIEVKESNGLTLSTPKIANDSISGKVLYIKTFELTKNSGMSKNIYTNDKSAYSILFEISQEELDSNDANWRENGATPRTRTIIFTIFDDERKIYFIKEVPYLFYDLDGNRISFGNQTSDIDDSGNIIEINNDFNFLYDRHWIKQYFDLSAPSFAFFPNTKIGTSESTPAEKQIAVGLSAGTILFDVSIDQPSPYGLEEVTVVVDVDKTIRNPNLDFTFSPTLVKWNTGEQLKKVSIDILDDKYVESAETISFKLVNFKSCLPKDSDSSIMKLTISDNDTPSGIRFFDNTLSAKSDVSFITFTYVFDKPLEVPNQTIELYLTPNTNAVLGTDFILDPKNPIAKSLKVNFLEGDISGSTTINIIDNDVYDLDKIIEIGFRNPTQNIIISNVGAVPNFGQVTRITIKDSINTQYSSFVLINNNDKNIRPVKAGKNPKAGLFGGKYANYYYWNNKFDEGFFPATNYNISITNDGATVVYNGKLINKNNTLTAFTISESQIDNIKIELPSNNLYDKPNKRYTKSKYNFNIESNDKFVTQEQNFGNHNIFIQKDYIPVNVSTEKDAGASNSKVYYLTTKLKNFLLNYNNLLSACTLNSSYDKVDVAYTNNLVFMGYPSHTTIGTTNATFLDSSTEVTFEDAKISSQCSQQLPFGFGKLPSPPYNFKYIELDMRNFYTQSTTPTPDSFNYLRLDIFNSTKRGFLKWGNSQKNTKESMILSILNNGEIASTISGNFIIQQQNSFSSSLFNIASFSVPSNVATINPGEKLYIRGTENDLEKMSIILPGNESFQSKSSTFVVANYILTLENVSYFGTNGLVAGTPVNFVFETTNKLISGPLSATPKYNIVTEYNDMNVPVEHDIFNNKDNNDNSDEPIDCVTDDFSETKLINCAIKGVMFPNSKSSFRRGYFVDSKSDISYSCLNTSPTRILFDEIQ